MPSSQRALEQEMAELGVARHKKKLAKAKAGERESTTKSGSRLLREAVGHLEVAIDAWKVQASSRPGPKHRAIEHIDLLPPALIAGLVCRRVLDCISDRKLYTRTAMQVASLIEDECRFRELMESHPETWRDIKKRIDTYNGYRIKRRHIVTAMNKMEHPFSTWGQAQKLQVGVVLLELFVQSTGLVEVYKRRDMFGKTRMEVQATEDTLKWIEASDEYHETLTPVYLPCVEPPQAWTTPLDGGFYSATLHQTALLKTHDKNHIDELHHVDMAPVYTAVNALQDTAWAINAAVLDVFKATWENGYDIGNMPPREDLPIPPKPANIDEDEDARKAWRRQAAQIHDRNISTRASRLAIIKVLHVAQKYLDNDLWFVHQLDWRGRAYPVAYHLHPQGPDHAKALLQFSKGDPIDSEGAWDWHRIHGANCWGVDKSSFKDRIKFIEDNQQDWLHVAEDPFANRRWEDADSPWMFLAWCLDYAACLKDKGHLSKLPIHQDATQSGIQIMSLLLRDPVGGRATNCVPVEQPQDLYADVAKEVEQRLREMNTDLAKDWLEFGIDRAACKRPVMTRVYNATIWSCSGYVREWAEAKAEKTGKKIPKRLGDRGYKPFWTLAEVIWEAMDSIMQGTAACQDWMRKVAQVFVKYDLAIYWATPVGLSIKQKYLRWTSKTVKTSVGDIIRQNRIRISKDEVDRRKMENGLAPNIVHSLDAAAMVATICRAKESGATSFAAVHDSFATTASHSALLASSIREAYIEIFEEDYLKQLKEGLEMQLHHTGASIPPLPAYGNLDVKGLRNSLYFFS